MSTNPMSSENAKLMNKKRPYTKNELQIELMVACSVVFLFVFSYLPMFGIILAFKEGDGYLNVLEALISAPWVGFNNFAAFLKDPEFVNILMNTLGLNLIEMVVSFPMPIIFALLMSEIPFIKYRTGIQTVVNFPHFISWVIFGGIIVTVIDPTVGAIGTVCRAFGITPVYLGEAKYFWGLLIVTSIIKNVGWSSIVYTAAISAVPTSQYEAATMDGVNRFQKAWYITLPSILPTITVYLLMAISRILNNSFETFYVLQNSVNLTRSEVLATYVYKMGIENRRYSYTTAVSLFQSVVSVILLVGSNIVSKKLTGNGIL